MEKIELFCAVLVLAGKPRFAVEDVVAEKRGDEYSCYVGGLGGDNFVQAPELVGEVFSVGRKVFVFAEDRKDAIAGMYDYAFPRKIYIDDEEYVNFVFDKNFEAVK